LALERDPMNTRRPLSAVRAAPLLAALAAAALLGGCAELQQRLGGARSPAASAPSPSARAPVAPPPAAAPAPAAAAPAPAAASAVAAAPAPAPAAPPVAAAPPAPPPPILPFDEAVLAAANNLLGKSTLPPAAGAPYNVVIDPLIDGVTGAQTNASRAMGERIVALIRERYAQQYAVQPFTAGNVQKSPLVLVGTFTGINKERKTEGAREAYRICLALADLKTGKLVSKGLAFAQPDGVDPTPLAFFRDSPAFSEDPTTTGYIRTCQGTRAGDPIHPLYIDRIVASSLIGEAVEAYAAGRYAEAREMYRSVLAAPAGHQFRAYSGLYLANWKLGRNDEAAQAFNQLVDHGLEHKKLGVKFLFRPGSIGFFAGDQRSGGALPYQLWLTEISAVAQKRQACMEVVGHTSPTGPEPVNERLSLMRAEYIKGQLERAAPALGKRLVAGGVGSRETLVGNGRDDASDALDRRVEFRVIGC
jgi:outer membrane protein OmpA-like peptidoglycan-associated protein